MTPIREFHDEVLIKFDSKCTDFDGMSTPFQRDIMKELVDACRKQDIKICWHHSIMDWHNPDYLLRRNWKKTVHRTILILTDMSNT